MRVQFKVVFLFDVCVVPHFTDATRRGRVVLSLPNTRLTLE